MIQILTVLPCSRALSGPNGFHVKGGSFVRNIYEPGRRDIDFVVCMHVTNEPPPEVEIEVFDPWNNDIYRSINVIERPHVSPIYEVSARVEDVMLVETGGYAFRVYLNGDAVFAGPLWGYNR